MIKKPVVTTNIIISHTSLNGADFKEAIDLGLSCAAFDQQVNLIFVDAGINNLIIGQSASSLKDKNQVDILKGLEFYDIDNIILEKESLDKTCLKLDDLLPSAQLKSVAEIKSLNLKTDNLVVF